MKMQSNNNARINLAVFEALEQRQLMSAASLYYSFDGTGNNPIHPNWGIAGANLLQPGTAYANGVSSMAAPNRADPRVISNTIATQLVDPEPNARNMSDMIYAWGQFIDHDLDLTPAGTTEYDPIAVPKGDTTFDPTSKGGQTIPFFRSIYDPTTGTTDPRRQPNTVTSFLDGSMVYGSSLDRANALRTFSGGRLKTSDGNLLPFNSEGLPVEVDLPVDPKSLFLTGDVRGNENIELASLQVLFVREHNYWADQLASQHPSWKDEKLYQSARQIVIAEIQNITYTEFLPALMGNNPLAPYKGYNAKVNAQISDAFSEAAFRVGHSLLNGNVDFFNNDGTESHDPLDFSASADSPGQLLQDGTTVDNILKYLAADNSQEIDNQTEDAFRNFLFDPSNTMGLDLYAIDIQRGRDVGLPDYNTVRAEYGLPKVTKFSQITTDPAVQAQLKQLYGNVNNIDLFVGGLAENHVAGSSLGPTFQRIISDQFQRTRDGDRLWFQQIFRGKKLQAIENTTLADIISRNTSIDNLQKDVFFFKTGTVAGHVFADSNHNGIQDPGEKGESGITIELFNKKGKLVGKTKTSSDGSYSFDTGKQDKDYKVVAISPGWHVRFTTPSHQSASLVDNSGAGEFDVDFGIAPQITLCAAEWKLHH